MKNAPVRELITSRKPAACENDGTVPGWNAYAAQCPTRFVLDRIADKWSVLILGAIGRRPLRFNMLLREVEGISHKVLSQTLKRLERDGLLSRTVHPTVPISVEYAVTPLGTTLASAVTVVIDWAQDHIELVMQSQRAYDQALLRAQAS